MSPIPAVLNASWVGKRARSGGKAWPRALSERTGTILSSSGSEGGFEEMDDPWLIQFAEIDRQWLLQRGLVSGVEAPITGDDVLATIAIEIRGGHAIPPAR